MSGYIYKIDPVSSSEFNVYKNSSQGQQLIGSFDSQLKAERFVESLLFTPCGEERPYDIDNNKS